MCIQVTELAGKSNADASPVFTPLPEFIAPSVRYGQECGHLNDAEACLRAATRHVKVARWTLFDQACKLIEEQVAEPFEKIVAANQYHVEAGNPSFLSEWEEDAFREYAKQARAFRRSQTWPKWTEIDAEYIGKLLVLFGKAVKAKAKDEDYTAVIAAALLDVVSPPIRSAE